MPGTGIAGDIARWQPSSVSPQAADFARAVVTQAAPGGRERAKNLLWAAGRLADWAIGLGLDPVPEVLLHSSVIERFTAHAPGLTGVTWRTLRTNLRFLARAVVPALAPADAPLPGCACVEAPSCRLRDFAPHRRTLWWVDWSGVRSYHWLSLTRSLRWRLAVVGGAGSDGSESLEPYRERIRSIDAGRDPGRLDPLDARGPGQRGPRR